MAQSTYASKYKTIRGAKNIVRIVGKHAFTTTGLTISISAHVNHILYASLTPVSPTLQSATTRDIIFWGTASIAPATNTIPVERGKDDGKSGMEFFYEIIGR